MNPTALLLGTRVTLWLGPALAVPAPAPVVEALSSIQVTQSSDGRDGFQLRFTLGRPLQLVPDYPLLANPLLRPFGRVVVQVWNGVVPDTLIDGFITEHHIDPGTEPGTATLTITGEDVRVMMDLTAVSMAYPNMPPNVQVQLILARYALYLGAPAVVIPPLFSDLRLVTDPSQVQNGTDLAYVEQLASEAGYVFFVEPTPAPMVNLAYFGPENRLSVPQPALSVNMGPETNVERLDFRYNALGPEVVLGAVQMPDTVALVPVVTFTSTRPPLAPVPALVAQLPHVRSRLPERASEDPATAYGRAQAGTDRAADAITATGEIDTDRYGASLRPRRLVGLRGAGLLFDGFYYVKSVTHDIRRGQYKQSFTLTREGFGPISPVVPT